MAGLIVAAPLFVAAIALISPQATGGPQVKNVLVAPVGGAASAQALAAAVVMDYPELPGIGARFGSRLLANTSQVVVAYGDGENQYTTTTEFFEKAADGWRLEGTWLGHNGYKGWTTHKITGDLKSPIGVFALTDAGGELPKPPGTELPYQRSRRYEDDGKGFFGESLRNAFHYVIAIDYNHVPGTPPSSPDYPLGAGAGTGVWLHVDHGGPTHACVSVPQQGMETLLEKLQPADHPMIIMGDRADLASG